MYWTSHIAGMDSRINAGLAGLDSSVFGTFGYRPHARRQQTRHRRADGRPRGDNAAPTPNLDGWTGSLSYATGETRGASGSPSASDRDPTAKRPVGGQSGCICTPMTATAA